MFVKSFLFRCCSLRNVLSQAGPCRIRKCYRDEMKTLSACFNKADTFLKLSNTSSYQSSSLLTSNKISIKLVDRHGKKHEVEATVGDTLLDVVIDNELNFESYGVCEGTVSCSTCHVILGKDIYESLEEPLMDEMDMLDLACGLTETSRLGCQIYITRGMNGATFTLPAEITDARNT